MELANSLFSTRRGAVAVGVVAALLAAVLLLVYLNRYRSSVKSSEQPATVLVAKNLIQKGTPGDVIGSTGQYEATSVPKTELRQGALVDASSLRGRVALADIYPGQQLTAADFTLNPIDAIGNKLTGSQRAIAITLDPQHGLLGQIQQGDRVDVYVGLNAVTVAGTVPVLKLLMENALVLRAAVGGTGNVVLRADAGETQEIAYAADNGKLWLVLRPSTGAKPEPPTVVSAQTLLFGVRPVLVKRP